MILQRFEVPGLAHYSYVLGSNGVAIVIDPKRDVDTYLEFAREKKLKIAMVTETHIHADYASGAEALAQAVGAELWLSGHDAGEEFQYQFAHRELRDGDELKVGALRLRVIHTPGHTPEHISFLMFEGAESVQPLGMFTGDFIMSGSLGRPDLLGEEEKRALATSLFDSVHRRIAGLPDGVEVYPAHGAGSLCGAGMVDRTQTSLGYERATNPYMKIAEEAEFVEQILATVPEFPEYYKKMKRLNSDGAKVYGAWPVSEGLGVKEFRELRRQGGAVVVDLRRPEAFGGAHVPGAINIGSGSQLPVWAAWVVPYDWPILLVGDAETDIDAAVRALLRVGLDGVLGHLDGGMQAWIDAGEEMEHTPQVAAGEVAAAGGMVLDVRSPAEWQTGHIAGALHIPAGELAGRVSEVPEGALTVVCGSGYRSSIATSLLQAAGRTGVTNMLGGMGAWMKRGLPVVG